MIHTVMCVVCVLLYMQVSLSLHSVQCGNGIMPQVGVYSIAVFFFFKVFQLEKLT